VRKALKAGRRKTVDFGVVRWVGWNGPTAGGELLFFYLLAFLPRRVSTRLELAWPRLHNFNE
jgi:hypothetical protein